MKTFEEIAVSMFIAYSKTLFNLTGAEHPPWNHLDPAVREGWIAAAKQAAAELALAHGKAQGHD
jgi:hypothetical protein